MNVHIRPRLAATGSDLSFECIALVLQGGGALGAQEKETHAERNGHRREHPPRTAAYNLSIFPHIRKDPYAENHERTDQEAYIAWHDVSEVALEEEHHRRDRNDEDGKGEFDFCRHYGSPLTNKCRDLSSPDQAQEGNLNHH
jgi:hypothetical protein